MKKEIIANQRKVKSCGLNAKYLSCCSIKMEKVFYPNIFTYKKKKLAIIK